MRTERRPVVSVVGSADCTEAQAGQAEAVGKLLAARGVVLVCGGRGGVMEAACRGAYAAGGITIGILPGSDPRSGNAFLTVALPTGLGEARNALVAQAGQAVIAIGGGTGTLSEIALALKAGRRVIGLKSWSGTSGTGGRLDILVAENPEQAVRLALLEES